MNSNNTAIVRRLCMGACVAGCLALPVLKAAAEDFDYSNWVDLSVGGAVVDGHEARFQQRHQIRKGIFGGVEALHMEKSVGEDAVFQIDGRGIFDNHNYLLRMELANPEVGYLRAGFRQFRTWFDGSGGFFPSNDLWFSLFDDDPLAIDRGEAWFEAGLTLPNWPRLTFRYSHQYREGDKDSTVWGRVGTPLTGVTGDRAIAPSFREIDERRHIFEGRASHTLGRTDFGAGLRYELSDQDNALVITQNTGQNTGPNTERRIRQEEGVTSDIFSVHAWQKTWLHEKVLFSTGYGFTTLDTELGGRRFYDPLARRVAGDTGFENLAGGSRLKQHVGNVNLMFLPWEHFTIVPSLRVEKEDLEGLSTFDRTAGPGVAGSITRDQFVQNERDMLTVSQRLEARYTGFQRWVLYARGDWEQGQGDLMERSIGFRAVDRLTDYDRFTQQYTMGANWYPHRVFNVAVQYYRRMRDNDYFHLVPDRPTRHSAFIQAQNFTTDDFNVRLTLRPVSGLTLVSRYDFQFSTVDMQGTGLPEIRSGEITSHIFSQAVTWMPLARLYVQAAANYAIDRTSSPADEIVGTAPAANRVLEAKNDYLTTSLNVGYVLNDKTDLQAQYLYYLADNYEDNSAFGVPYGAGAREHAVTAGIVHRLRKNLVWSLKYGFFNYRDETSGWNANYDAHLVYSGLSFRF